MKICCHCHHLAPLPLLLVIALFIVGGRGGVEGLVFNEKKSKKPATAIKMTAASTSKKENYVNRALEIYAEAFPK